VAEAFNDGVTVKVLMERHQVTRGTILEHLTKYMLTGNPLRKQEDLQTFTTVTNEQRMAAFRAFEELGPTMLKPIFERLNGAVNYDELKILRLLFLIDQKSGETAGPAWDGSF
jgi:ATP-dependent DNA helicase RecQ